MKQISQEDFEKAMKGIVSDTDAALRDEAPQAYKVTTTECSTITHSRQKKKTIIFFSYLIS